ncbi:MAG: recombinase family protein [Patescibacteria group bacterium]|nr:recombinase family protein [Patescibacteria group bacterium]
MDKQTNNRLLENTFYYGPFEYPKGSGNWYQGKHESIITKELFDAVQQQMKNSQLVRRENIEFAFTKITKCGLCGSGISATEKFKKLKDGSYNRHVYYGCTKARDKNCKSGYISEEELIKQLQKLVDSLNFKKISVQDKIRSEIKRFKKFQVLATGKNDSIDLIDVDTRNYIKFLLKEGDDQEKRDLLTCLDCEIKLKNKKI